MLGVQGLLEPLDVGVVATAVEVDVGVAPGVEVDVGVAPAREVDGDVVSNEDDGACKCSERPRILTLILDGLKGHMPHTWRTNESSLEVNGR